MLVIKAIIVVLALLCLPHSTHAQDYSKLPELPVWYELENTSFGKNMTYLPNFDTARGGFNALTQNVGTTQNATIYNRYKGDTVNMFQWSTTFYDMISGDFNGDGIRDYMGGSGEVYQGIKNGIPPKLPHVAGGYPTGYGSYVNDFDNDGKSDVIKRSNDEPDKLRNLGNLIFGNADLSKMQVVALPHTVDTVLWKDCILDAYTNNGKARLLVLAANDKNKSAKLVLYDMRFVTAGSTISVVYNRLHEITLTYYSSISSVGVSSLHNSTHTLIRFDDIYVLDSDKIEYLFKSPNRLYKLLKHSASNVNESGYIAIGNINDPDQNKRLGLLISGTPRKDTVPFAFFRLAYQIDGDNMWGIQNAISIGDVNHDGFGDIAVFYKGIKNNEGYNKFAIYLGIDKNVGVNEQPQNTTTKHIAISVGNAVVSKSSSFDVHATAEHSGTYTIDLYAMDGKKITTLWSGALHQGETDIPLPPLPPTLAAGRYNLMIDNGTQFNVCGVIVQ